MNFHHYIKIPIMNTTVTGYWNGKKVKLKEKFPHITEEDLNYREGKEQEMMEILGYKLGLSKQELLNVIVTL